MHGLCVQIGTARQAHGCSLELLPGQVEAIELLQAPEDHLLLISPGPLLRVHPLAPLQEELPVIPALARSRNGLVEGQDEGAIQLFVIGAALRPVRGREHDVRQLRRGGEVEVLDYDEV